jgi:hypothetical protein
MFAALKYQRAEAKLSYSDYCTYSAQQRYFDYDHFKKQMYKVHRPHLLSGYLKATRYEQTRDADEKTDWIMYYAPGPKAKAEYHTFTRSGRVLETSAETVGEEVKLSEKPPAAPRRTGPRQKRLNLQEPVDNPTLGEMIRRGISRARAQAILAAAPQPELVMDQLEWGDAQISRSRPGEIRNPAGFYIHLVKENILPPPGFETTRRAKLREEAYRAEQEENYQRLLQEEAYQRYRGETIESFIREQRLEGECQRLAEKATGEIRAQWRRNAPADVVTELADRKARQIIAERIPALLTLEAFIQQNKQAIPAP